ETPSVGVVVHDERSVGGPVDVELDSVGAARAGSNERLQCVFGGYPVGPTMGEHARCRHRHTPRKCRSDPLRLRAAVNTLRYCLEVGSPRMLVNGRTSTCARLVRRPRVPEASWRSLGSELMTGTWTRGAVALRAVIPTPTSSSPSGAPALPSSRSKRPGASAPPATGTRN